MNNLWVRAYSDTDEYFYINTADVTAFFVGRNGPDTAWIIWADHKIITGGVGLIGEWDTEAAAATALRNLLRGSDLSD